MRPSTLLPAVLALGLAALDAQAVPLRAPQVPFDYAPLQADVAGITSYPVNVATDQLDIPSWSVGVLGSPYPTATLRRGGGVTIGIYGTGSASPTLAPLFDPGASPGSYAALQFGASGLKVARFDANSVFLGMQTYPDIHSDHFQFYVQGPCGTWFGEDARNTPPGPHVLAYENPDDPILCFEACPYTVTGPSPSTFTSAIVDLFALPPLGSQTGSWGALKAHYR